MLSWFRGKSLPTNAPGRHAGLDLTASRLRGSSVGADRFRPLTFADPREDLPLFVTLTDRPPRAGLPAYRLVRRLPHAVCSAFLPHLGKPKEWRADRLTLTPEAALAAAFAAAAPVVAAETDAVAVALPAYLTAVQAAKASVVAAKAGLPVKGTTSAALAVVADRAIVRAPAGGSPRREGVVPFPNGAPPGGHRHGVVVVDVDEFALFASVIGVGREEVRAVGPVGVWPRAGLKAWSDRLINAVSGRCVRVCRRDPRDSAEAEQSLFEQLDAALDKLRPGVDVTISLRTDHWYQDLKQTADEFAADCRELAASAADGVRELVDGCGLAMPPRAVWLTHAAGRLPGLLAAVREHSPAGTAVEVLPPRAVSEAAAGLVGGWLAGDLPKVHLDTSIPLRVEPAAPAPAPEPVRPASGQRPK